jgi:hypothetical protein
VVGRSGDQLRRAGAFAEGPLLHLRHAHGQLAVQVLELDTGIEHEGFGQRPLRGAVRLEGRPEALVHGAEGHLRILNRGDEHRLRVDDLGTHVRERARHQPQRSIDAAGPLVHRVDLRCFALAEDEQRRLTEGAGCGGHCGNERRVTGSRTRL